MKITIEVDKKEEIADLVNMLQGQPVILKSEVNSKRFGQAVRSAIHDNGEVKQT